MTSTSHVFFGPIAASLAVMLLAAPVSAQESTPTTLEASAQIPTAPVQRMPTPIEPPYWSTSSGFEGDTHGTGYGYLGPSYHKPLTPRMQFVAGASVNYLYYGWDSGGGTETRVTSPGLSTKAGLRFGDRNWFQISAGPGFKRKHRIVRDAANRIISSDKNLEVGLGLGADVYANPSRRNNIHGMLNYGAEDGYTWGRVGFKQQVTNYNWRSRFTHYLGTEYIGQGNKDIRSNQYGGFIEFLHVPSTISVMMRAGYKHTAFDVGPDKSGPWYAISFYRRLGER